MDGREEVIWGEASMNDWELGEGGLDFGAQKMWFVLYSIMKSTSKRRGIFLREGVPLHTSLKCIWWMEHQGRRIRGGEGRDQIRKYIGRSDPIERTRLHPPLAPCPPKSIIIKIFILNAMFTKHHYHFLLRKHCSTFHDVAKLILFMSFKFLFHLLEYRMYVLVRLVFASFVLEIALCDSSPLVFILACFSRPRTLMVHDG